MQTHDWEGCPKLETVAWAWASLCWWICTRSRVPVTLHSSGFTYSWPSALTYWLQRSLREGDTPWLQLLFSALSSCTEAAAFEAGSSPGSRTIRSVSFVRIDGEFDMLTFSFSQLLPRMLPWHSLQFHSTSFNFLTGREARGARSVSCPNRPPPPPRSSLVCKSRSKFGSVISGWSEPVFVGIILHRRLGLKLKPALDIEPWSALALIRDSSTWTLHPT